MNFVIAVSLNPEDPQVFIRPESHFNQLQQEVISHLVDLHGPVKAVAAVKPVESPQIYYRHPQSHGYDFCAITISLTHIDDFDGTYIAIAATLNGIVICSFGDLADSLIWIQSLLPSTDHLNVYVDEENDDFWWIGRTPCPHQSYFEALIVDVTETLHDLL